MMKRINIKINSIKTPTTVIMEVLAYLDLDIAGFRVVSSTKYHKGSFHEIQYIRVNTE